MDPFENLPETPDLSGQVTPLGYRPVFIGPYSCVYRGKIRSTGESVAIKVLNAVEGTALHTMRRKLNRERRTWGALNHPNILPLYGFADDEEMFQPFGALISPWLQNGDASRFLAERGDSLTLDQRIQLLTDVISGVDYLHSHQPLLVHGDLKPRNILIDDLGRARICDFGLVRIFMDEGNSGMTTTTQHTGTERYLAYELAMAGEGAIPTTASDMYAVGCIGLEVIFSQVPYSTRKNNYGGMIYVDIRNGVSPAECPTNLSRDLSLIWLALEGCWHKEPSRRLSAGVLLSFFVETFALMQDDFPTPDSINRISEPEIISWVTSDQSTLDTGAIEVADDLDKMDVDDDDWSAESAGTTSMSWNPPRHDHSLAAGSSYAAHDQSSTGSHAFNVLIRGRRHPLLLSEDLETHFPNSPELAELALYIMNQPWCDRNEEEPLISLDEPVILLKFFTRAPTSRFEPFFDTKLRCYVVEANGDRCLHVTTRKDRAVGHARAHFGYKPFACGGKCGKVDCLERYTCPSFRNDHVGRRRSPKRPCDVCHKLVTHQNLNRHMKQHNLGNSFLPLG